LAKEIKNESIDLQRKTIVAVCTGHGLKDLDIISRSMPIPQKIPAEISALQKVIASA
jgi:threonine synthase